MKVNDSLWIVDDDDIYQMILQAELSKIAPTLSTMTFSDGEKAYNYIETHKDSAEKLPGMILLDINMPFMDGWQFIEQFQVLKPEITRDIIIYMVSSSIDPDDIAKAEQFSEISDYVIKPVSAKELNTMLQQLN